MCSPSNAAENAFLTGFRLPRDKFSQPKLEQDWMQRHIPDRRLSFGGFYHVAFVILPPNFYMRQITIKNKVARQQLRELAGPKASKHRQDS